MNRTQIEWVRNPDGSQGYTWNPITGCLNHTNGLCKGGNFPCYAYKLANGRLKSRYLANSHIPLYDIDTFEVLEDFEKGRKIKAFNLPFYPRFWEERLAEMTRRNDRLYYDGAKVEYPISPRGIFMCDMGDLFGIGVPEKWTERVLDEIWGNRGYDRFYLLTKQAQELIKWSLFPENCWVGVTATNHKMFVEACLILGDVQSKVKYISLEPLLKWGDFPANGEAISQWAKGLKLYGINWLIIGACTGTESSLIGTRLQHLDLKVMQWGNRWTLQPKIEWVQEIVEAADKAGIPVFLKDNLMPLMKWPDSGSWAFQPVSNMLRQEMPELCKGS